MITSANVKLCPPSVRDEFDDLARAWPVGARVRHADGWTGHIRRDVRSNRLSITGGVGAHAILAAGGCEPNTAVCVTWDCGGRPAIAWFRPAVLQLEQAHPAPRRHPRRRAA